MLIFELTDPLSLHPAAADVEAPLLPDVDPLQPDRLHDASLRRRHLGSDRTAEK